MKIVQVHKIKSQPVADYSQIERIARELKDFADNGPFIGQHKSCLALHHSQVSAEPFNFFVVSIHAAHLFPDGGIIINPDILWVDDQSKGKNLEGCMSWPFRGSTKVKRWEKILVGYQLFQNGKLESREEYVSGLKAYIFQHEIDHARGKTIYG